MDTNTATRDPFAMRCVDCLFRWGSLAMNVALGSIAGYMLLGAFLGLVGQFANVEIAAKHGPGTGWVVGAIAAFAGSIDKLKRPFFDSNKSGSSKASKAKSLLQESRKNATRIAPDVKRVLKGGALCSIFGAVLGVMLSLYLSILLVSFTTSPFVPRAWRASATPRQDFREERRPGIRRSRDSHHVGSSFSHPLLAPIFGYSTLCMTGVGCAVGVWLAFYPDEPAKQGGSES